MNMISQLPNFNSDKQLQTFSVVQGARSRHPGKHLNLMHVLEPLLQLLVTKSNQITQK